MIDIKKINELLNVIQIRDVNETNNYLGKPNTIVFLQPNFIAIISGFANYCQYNNILANLYNDNKEIYETVSKQAFIKYVENKIIFWKVNTHEIISKDIEEIYSYFLNQKLIEYQVIKEINGIVLQNTQELKLDSFTIYSQSYYRELLKKQNKIFELDPDIFWRGWNGEYLIIKKIKARDTDKAKEIAFELFSKLELFIYYTLNEYNEKHLISIVSKLPFPYENCHIFSDQATTTSISRNIITPIVLDSDYFHNDIVGNNNLWSLIDNNNLDEMKKRIVSAIEWIGKANAEINTTNRFLFYIISLESVFTIQEKTLVNPSVANCICEGVAFILGTSKDERIEIEKKIKELYSLRSTLAHGKNKNIKSDDLFNACFFSTRVIQSFLSNPELYKIKTSQALITYLKEKKYS